MLHSSPALKLAAGTKLGPDREIGYLWRTALVKTMNRDPQAAPRLYQNLQVGWKESGTKSTGNHFPNSSTSACVLPLCFLLLLSPPIAVFFHAGQHLSSPVARWPEGARDGGGYVPRSVVVLMVLDKRARPCFWLNLPCFLGSTGGKTQQREKHFHHI